MFACPTKIAFFGTCVVHDRGVLRLWTHCLRSLLQAPYLCRQGVWRRYNRPICGSMTLLHGCRWFCKLCVHLQQLNNVGTKRDFACGGLGYNAACRTSDVGLQWTSNGCSWQGQTLFPGWRRRLCISSRLARYKCSTIACHPKRTCSLQCFTTMGHDLRSSIGLVPGHGVAKKCSSNLSLLPHTFS
jgi:hypothetical protein